MDWPFKTEKLDTNDFFKRKHLNEEMEAEQNEIDSRTENLAVSEDANVYEAIPIYLKKQQSTEAYKETMSKDIDNIDTYETRTKVNTTK